MADIPKIIVTDDGPMLVSGPVDIVMPDGRRVRSNRPFTAICVCRRSRRLPFCDTSHRQKVRTTDESEEKRAAPHRTVAN